MQSLTEYACFSGDPKNEASATTRPVFVPKRLNVMKSLIREEVETLNDNN